MGPQDTIVELDVEMLPYLLISTRLGRVMLALTSFGPSLSIKPLHGSSPPMSKCAAVTWREDILLVIAVFELHSLPIKSTSFMFFLPFLVIILVSETPKKFALLITLHAGYCHPIIYCPPNLNGC